MNIAWSPEALEDLASLRAYIAEDNSAAARRVVRHIVQNIEQLLPDNPNIGRAGRYRAPANLSFQGHPISCPIGSSAAQSRFCASTTVHGVGLTDFDRPTWDHRVIFAACTYFGFWNGPCVKSVHVFDFSFLGLSKPYTWSTAVLVDELDARPGPGRTLVFTISMSAPQDCHTGQVGENEVCTSITVAAELRYGSTKKNSSRLTAQPEAVLGAIEVLALEPPVDAVYGVIRAGLERSGQPIGANDLLIAAHALSLDLTLVTDNEREFMRIG